MNEWKYNATPTADGWYAVLKCWDAEEGIFPDAALRTGETWSEPAILAFNGPFATQEEAYAWARENDIGG